MEYFNGIFSAAGIYCSQGNLDDIEKKDTARFLPQPRTPISVSKQKTIIISFFSILVDGFYFIVVINF